jgi:hypothetical protein
MEPAMEPLVTQDPMPAEVSVVTKALIRAADNLALPNRVLGAVIGLSEPTVSRMKNGNYVLTQPSKEFELSVLFIRMYRSLSAIVGGDDAIAQAWLRNNNSAIQAVPIDRIQSVDGLLHVIQYLDARRAIV